MSPERFVGIDVAQATVVVAVRPEGRTWEVTTKPAHLARLARELQQLAPALVVLEGAGGALADHRVSPGVVIERALAVSRVVRSRCPVADR